jgi:hypothetical protein
MFKGARREKDRRFLEIARNPRTIRARAHRLLGLAHFTCGLCPAHDETILWGNRFAAPCKGRSPSSGPGDICPPQAPNLWVDFEIIDSKVIGPACGFVAWPDFCTVVGCSPRALSGF